MRSPSLSLSALALALAATACGGNVVFVEGDGSGGAGSAVSTPSSSTSSVMTDAVSSSQTGMGDACQQFCAVAPECFGDPGACASQCGQIYVAGCEAQADALLLCLVQFIQAGCDLPPDACFFESEQYNQCVQPGDCSNQDCFGNELSCSCSGSCNGSFVEVDCKQDMNGSSCDCFFDGQYSAPPLPSRCPE